MFLCYKFSWSYNIFHIDGAGGKAILNMILSTVLIHLIHYLSGWFYELLFYPNFYAQFYELENLI